MFGNPGNGMLVNLRDCGRGVDPLKKEDVVREFADGHPSVYLVCAAQIGNC